MDGGGPLPLGVRVAALVVPLVALLLAPAPAAAATPLSVNSSGANGVGRIVSPGRPCSDGGVGEYRHYGVETTLQPGAFSQLPGVLRGTIDVHDDPTIPTNTPKAFLLPNESHATLANERGAVQVGLVAGGPTIVGTVCPQPSLALNGTQVSGPGTWSVANGTGAYRQATGSGTFNLVARLSPGAANPWALQLSGSLTVLQPTLNVSVDHTYWANFGLDYLANTVTVVYKVSNTGPGDAFNVVFQNTTSSSSGVTPLGPTPQALGDMLANSSTLVKVRYKLAFGQPCPTASANLNCPFQTTVTVLMPDALDVDALAPQKKPVTVITPASPLVLS